MADYTSSNTGAVIDAAVDYVEILDDYLTISSNELIITGQSGVGSDTVLLNLKANNSAGKAGNVLRFTDTDPTAVNNGSMGKVQWFSTTTGAVVAEINGKNDDTTPDGQLIISTAAGSSLTQRIDINADGDIQFFNAAGTSRDLHWDATDSRLGINVTSPTEALDVLGNANFTGTVTADGLTVNLADNAGVLLQSPNDSSTAFLKFGDSTSNDSGSISYDHFSDALRFKTINTERLRIASNGDISFYEDTGTTAKFFWDASTESLEIDSVSANPLVLERNGGTDANVSIQFNCTTNDWYAGTNPANNFAIGTSLDQTNAPFQIDSSGNLLVGRTTSFSSSRTEIQSSGSGGTGASECLSLNNTGADGDMLEFYKAGTSVGSIGTKSGDLTIGTGDTGVQFYDFGNSIVPTNLTTNTNIDATIDLGLSGTRFKDLYLSGGVYLGGTGAANKLDDYEEGTFTPTFGGSTTDPTVTYATQSGVYTKIGNLVTATVVIGTSANTGGAGAIEIKGLPFASKNDADYRARDMINTFNLDVDTNCVGVGIEGVQNANYLLMLESRDNQVWRQVDWSQATSASIYFAFTFQYYV